MTDLMTTIRTLSAGLATLNDADRRFAKDLLDSVAKYNGSATVKQAFWLEKLAERTKTGGVDPTVTEAVGDMAGIYALFDTAKAHLKFPAIVLGYKRGHEDRELRINVATTRARFPGTLNVKDEADDTWYGRVHPDGRFEHSRRDSPPSGVTMVLKAFSADPARVAGEHGHLTGKCCFCNRALSDERSTAVGYGATCAAHYGMPWGAKAAAAAAAGRDDHDDPVDPDAAGEEEYDRAEDRAIAGAEAYPF